MFFYVQLTQKIEVEPIYLDAKHEKGNVLKKTIETLEGKWILHYGYIVAICSIDHIDKGFVDSMTYNFVYHVTFHAVIFRLIEGEITPARFETITNDGMMFNIGPCYIFVPHFHISQQQQKNDKIVTKKTFQKYHHHYHDLYRLVILKYHMRENKLSALASLKDDHYDLLGAKMLDNNNNNDKK